MEEITEIARLAAAERAEQFQEIFTEQEMVARGARVARIVSLLEHEHAHVRAAALQAFGALPEQERVARAARIVSLLENPDADVRMAALQAFQALPEQERMPHAAPIVLLLEDPNADVWMAALEAFQALPEQQRVLHAALCFLCALQHLIQLHVLERA